VKVVLLALRPAPPVLSAALPLKLPGTVAALKVLPLAGVVTDAVVGAVASQVTVLSVLVEALFPTPEESWAAFALTVAITVPLVVIPVTATL
jgi:hypothetical protein